MFFILSKTLRLFCRAVESFHLDRACSACFFCCTRFTRLASWLIVTSLVLLAIAGLSPLGNALILPLEHRFPPWDPSRGAPDGIVVLGGAISPDVSDARGAVALDEAAERITATAELARRYPDARIIFSGGSGALSSSATAPRLRSPCASWRRWASRTIASLPKSNRAIRSKMRYSRACSPTRSRASAGCW